MSAWQSFLQSSEKPDHELFRAGAAEILSELTRAYRAGDLVKLGLSKQMLEQSRSFCQEEPFRGNYEHVMVFAILYAALIGIDNFAFDYSYSLCEGADAVLRELELRKAATENARSTDYVRLLLMSVMAEAKWKGPDRLKDRFVAPEDIVTAIQAIADNVQARHDPAPSGYQYLLLQVSVSLLVMAARWCPKLLDEVTVTFAPWIGFSPSDDPEQLRDNHTYWRYQAGLCFLESPEDESRLQTIEVNLVRTLPGDEVDQYLASTMKELSWIRKSRLYSIN